MHLSGIQPSGRFHLGNYLGCIKPFLKIQNVHTHQQKNIFLIADLHCLTKPENCTNLHAGTIEAVKSLLALGIDPKHVDIVQQSSVIAAIIVSHRFITCMSRFWNTHSYLGFCLV
jgi:tryptophanyl-tRNA synthetase